MCERQDTEGRIQCVGNDNNTHKFCDEYIDIRKLNNLIINNNYIKNKMN